MNTFKCVKMLRRRADYLKRKIESGNTRKIDNEFDQREYAALTWAIALIEQYSLEIGQVQDAK